MQKGVHNKGAIVMLWLTAAIWGFAFVAQKEGMEHVGPFTFNAIRFLLGSISLLPLIVWQHYTKNNFKKENNSKLIKGGVLAGVVLFTGASLQQVGMVYTSAGKAGFITGFYVVLVPIIGIFIGQHITRILWLGAVIALAGLYLLTVNGPFILEKGDLLILISAFFWAMHVQIINRLVDSQEALPLSAMQFAICGILSMSVAAYNESITIAALSSAKWSLLYGGLISVGIAYTLQVVAQKYVHPAYASIILSFETVFAVIGGWLILNEILGIRALFGCVLMLAGMLLVQMWGSKK